MNNISTNREKMITTKGSIQKNEKVTVLQAKRSNVQIAISWIIS